MGFAISIIESENPQAKSFVKNPLNITTNPLKISKIIVNIIKTTTLNAPFFELAMKFGKKLCVKAPSPKIRLKRLGNLNAAKKISLYIPAPRM